MVRKIIAVSLLSLFMVGALGMTSQSFAGNTGTQPDPNAPPPCERCGG